jgi:hypothetical protein
MINFFNRLETFPGGGTFWGLGRLLTKAKGFDEVAYVLNHFCFFFLSPMPSRFNHSTRTGEAGRCGFLFYARSIALFLIIGVKI